MPTKKAPKNMPPWMKQEMPADSGKSKPAKKSPAKKAPAKRKC